MTSYISSPLRRFVIQRAQGLCEYCLIHADDTYLGCEIDHIISEKHHGPTEPDNLALACFVCNHRKGSDIGSILWRTRQLFRLFSPRKDRWSDHFRLEQTRIQPISEIGEVTAQLLGFNDEERLLERQVLIAAGRYPSPQALTRMQR